MIRAIVPRTADGVTFLPAAGVWYQDGKLAVDETVLVEVATDRIARLREVLRWAAQRLRQDVIYRVVSNCGWVVTAQ